LDWVIVGGESGPGARRMELSWAKALVDDCRALGIACFVKQLGSAHGPRKGGDMTTWPAVLRVREYPEGQP
jgi:protein gp37